MFRMGLVICLIALACGSAFPQQPAGGDEEPACSFSGIYRKDGWTIPGMPAAKAESVRKPLIASMPGVFVTNLTPAESQTTITNIGCSREHNGSLEIREQPIGVIRLLSLDYGGRVFAYCVRYGTERIENGTRVDAGMEAYAMFYDLDGSGRFTLLKSVKRAPVPDFIPDWVKKGADAASSK
jgi:hypothetical protein